MPNFFGGIPLLLKEPIKLYHLCRDVFEQVHAHPNMPTKIALEICRIFIEIHTHQLVVAFNPFLLQLLPTKNQATNFLLLIGAANQQHDDVLFFLNIKFIVGSIIRQALQTCVNKLNTTRKTKI
jgi:hypothetical protein